MAKQFDRLTEGESVILTARSGWRSYIQPAFVTLILAVLYYAALHLEGILRLLQLAIDLALTGWAVRFYALRLRAYLVLTDRRVYGEMGFFVTRTMEVPLSKVGGVYIEQNPIGRVTGRGTVAISAAGSLFVFAHIPACVKVRDELMRQVERVQNEDDRRRSEALARAMARTGQGRRHRHSGRRLKREK